MKFDSNVLQVLIDRDGF